LQGITKEDVERRVEERVREEEEEKGRKIENEKGEEKKEGGGGRRRENREENKKKGEEGKRKEDNIKEYDVRRDEKKGIVGRRIREKKEELKKGRRTRKKKYAKKGGEKGRIRRKQMENEDSRRQHCIRTESYIAQKSVDVHSGPDSKVMHSFTTRMRFTQSSVMMMDTSPVHRIWHAKAIYSREISLADWNRLSFASGVSGQKTTVVFSNVVSKNKHDRTTKLYTHRYKIEHNYVNTHTHFFTLLFILPSTGFKPVTTKSYNHYSILSLTITIFQMKLGEKYWAQ
jgi:hypothetical protein